MPEDLDRCYLAAMRILRYRFNSEAELRRKLRGKRFDDDIVAATISRLREERWMDDARFAGAFVRTRVQKRVGRRRILRELQAAGVSDDEAERAIAENVDGEIERASLAALGERRARVLIRRHGTAYLATDEGRNKLAVYLLNQGYDAALVYEALKEITVVHHQPDS